MGFVAVHFDQFFSQLGEGYGLVNASYTDDPQIWVFIMMTDARERFVYKRVKTNIA